MGKLMLGIGAFGLLAGCHGVREAAADGSGEKLTLAQAGATPYVITLAETASAPEKTAATELAAYLKQVTGAEFAVVAPAAAAGRPVLAVGPGAAKAIAPKLDLTKTGATGLGDDGIVIKTVPPHLVLTGAEGAKRGTLYAVYEFLERECGVRWWTHTEEFVPSKPRLTVGALNTRYKPPFLYRETFSWGMVHEERQWGYDDSDAAVQDWAKAKFAARLRNNGHGTAMPASLGGCYMPLGWCHTFYPFMPPDKYFKDHPDWYSEIDGKRTADKAQLCMSNDEMLAEFAKNVLEKIRQQPHLGMVVITMNDWYGNCQCAKCKALDEAAESPMGSLLYGVNKIAEAVEREFPDFLVATHAYLYSRKPPKTIRPRDNVVIWYCVIERTATQPIDSDANRKLMDDLRGWAKVAPRMFVWDYTMNLMGPMAPHPNWQVFAPDLRAYREQNAIGVILEAEAVSVSDLVDLKVYLQAHLLWDPARDPQAIMDEFLAGYYGKAAPALREMMALLEDRARKVSLMWTEGPDASWLDLPAMNRADELLEQAEAAVAGDQTRLARVRRARLAIDHQWLYGYWGYRNDATRKGMPFRGPADPAVAAADFAARVRAEAATWGPGFMTHYLPVLMGHSFDVALENLAKRAITQPSPPGPLPAQFQSIAGDRIVDIDEATADIFMIAGGAIVDDPKASNGKAMRVPKAPVPAWTVQAKTKRLVRQGGFGRYRVYAVVRCELQADAGLAFVGGVYDNQNSLGVAAGPNGVELGTVSFPIGKPAAPAAAAQVDANPEIRFASVTSGAPVTDGEYHVYDFGVYDLPHDDMIIWVGTTTGDIYVDRFLFVREP